MWQPGSKHDRRLWVLLGLAMATAIVVGLGAIYIMVILLDLGAK